MERCTRNARAMDAPRDEPGRAKRAGVRRLLGGSGLQREAEETQEWRRTRWRMRCQSRTKNRRGHRREAEEMICGKNQRLPSRPVLYGLELGDQRKIIVAELLATRRHAIDRMRGNRMVRDRGQTIPAACIGNAYEQRKDPYSQKDRGESPAATANRFQHDQMPMWQFNLP